MKEHVQEGAFCIDATMGNGVDTEYLCRLAGASGHVLAFDIQEAALRATEERLARALPFCNYELLLESHSRMSSYAREESADCIVFNLGYLPGGDRRVITRPATTLEALDQSLALLKRGGLLSVCMYSGWDGDEGEQDRVLEWLHGLDFHRYLALVTHYYNRPNHPPVPAAVIKL